MTTKLHKVNVRHIEAGQFTRRDAMTTKLQDWLVGEGSRRIAIVGQGGSGKSTLVQCFLHAEGSKVGVYLASSSCCRRAT